MTIPEVSGESDPHGPAVMGIALQAPRSGILIKCMGLTEPLILTISNLQG